MIFTASAAFHLRVPSLSSDSVIHQSLMGHGVFVNLSQEWDPVFSQWCYVFWRHNHFSPGNFKAYYTMFLILLQNMRLPIPVLIGGGLVDEMRNHSDNFEFWSIMRLWWKCHDCATVCVLYFRNLDIQCGQNYYYCCQKWPILVISSSLLKHQLSTMLEKRLCVNNSGSSTCTPTLM